MSSLSFSQNGNLYESDVIQLTNNSVLELNFESLSASGVSIWIMQSLTQEGWQGCYSDTLRQGTTWCKTLAGVSESAYYKVVCTAEPKSANYE